MNLHSIVTGAIASINPLIPVTIKISTGSVTNPDGSRSPAYSTPQQAMAQLQALEYNDIVQADSLNIQGVRRKMYIKGDVQGLLRVNNKGGDLVYTPDGLVWKIAMVAEHWPDWTACILTLQNGS